MNKLKFAYLMKPAGWHRLSCLTGLLGLLCMIYGCASSVMGYNPYVGVSSGRYSSVYYRVEGNELMLSYENNTDFTMSNLVIVVEQQTTSGSNEIQSHKRSLLMNQSQKLTLIIPRTATGYVSVTSYFVITSPIVTGIGTSSDALTMISEPASDHVKFRIDPPKFLIN